jgi:hypothetical protein
MAKMASLLLRTTGNQALDAVVLVLTVLASIFFATRAFTEIRFWVQSRGNAGRFRGREPLTLPYTIPWLGGATRMLNGHAMYNYAK